MYQVIIQVNSFDQCSLVTYNCVINVYKILSFFHQAVKYNKTQVFMRAYNHLSELFKNKTFLNSKYIFLSII